MTGQTMSHKVDDGSKPSKPCEDFDEILELIGAEGKFQKFLLYVIICPYVAISPFMVLSQIFLWDTPDHYCHVPGMPAEMEVETWKNMTLPWEIGPDGQWRHSQCRMKDPLYGNITSCQHGWIYSTTDYDSTIPSTYNWVCDRDQYATDCFTWDSMGNAVGTVIFGLLADRWGRKPIFFLTCFTNVLFKTTSLFFPHHITLYKTLQFLGGLAYPAIFTMPVLICAEVSGTQFRAWIYAITWMVWVVGNALIPLVAMVCRTWFLFGSLCAIPGFLMFFYFPLVRESPRWLITQGKEKQAAKIILGIARTNRKTVDPEIISQMVKDLVEKVKTEEKGKVGVWTLFSRWRLARNTVMLSVAFVINTLLYNGVTINTTKMEGNKFLNYFLLALVELPGGWLAGKLVEATGRRWTQAGFFGFCALSCGVSAVAVLFPDSATPALIGALGIKFGVSVTSLVVYLQSAEIFPTQLRSTGGGLATTVGFAFGVLGPYIVYSGTTHVSFPYAILCFCSFIGVISAAYLPETLNQPLPETVEDANNFGRKHSFWSYLPKAEKSESESRDKI